MSVEISLDSRVSFAPSGSIRKEPKPHFPMTRTSCGAGGISLFLTGFILFCVAGTLFVFILEPLSSFGNWLDRRRASRLENKLLRLAKKGDVSACRQLGNLYDKSHRYSYPYHDNAPRAYAFYSIAAKQGDKGAESAMRRVEENMFSDQIAEAQKLSSELWEKYVVPFQKN